MIELCPPSPAPHDHMHDKWKLLSLLSDAAEAYELSHRTLSVLRALLTFLPERMITPAPHSAIVFPSNKTLSTRLNGMPESTIRRHISQLIKAGLVSRHDSANRKRFARVTRHVGQVAFGFDLSPLAREAEALDRHALAARRLAEKHAMLRAELAQLRQCLIVQHENHELIETAFRTLRRKPVTHDLEELCEQIKGVLETKKMSSPVNQNERHIQIEDKYISVSVERSQMILNKNDDDKLISIVDKCKEYKNYFPSTPSNWHELVNIADRLTPMIGIERPVFEEAMRVMGVKRASTVILCILEKLGTIVNPGGYLRRLTQMARAGQLYIENMLNDGSAYA
jgi:replication initiation protein RepC